MPLCYSIEMNSHRDEPPSCESQDQDQSYYLHFTDNGIWVDEGQILAAGDALGYGGATGLAWTPHLHFEVQQRSDTGWVAVDPFGWQRTDVDPWYVASQLLWDATPQE